MKVREDVDVVSLEVSNFVEMKLNSWSRQREEGRHK